MSLDLYAYAYAASSVQQCVDEKIDGEWLKWVPILTWNTNIPEGVVVDATYKTIGKTVFMRLHITATDGKGTTQLKTGFPLPRKAPDGVHEGKLYGGFIGSTVYPSNLVTMYKTEIYFQDGPFPVGFPFTIAFDYTYETI